MTAFPLLASASLEPYLNKLDEAGKTSLLNNLSGSTNLAVQFEVAQYYYKTHDAYKSIHLFSDAVLNGKLTAQQLLRYLDNDAEIPQNDKSVEILLTAKVLVQTAFTNNQAAYAQDFLTTITVGGNPFSWETAKMQLIHIPGIADKLSKIEEAAIIEQSPPISGLTGASPKSLTPKDEQGFAFATDTNLAILPDKKAILHENLKFGGIATGILLLTVAVIAVAFKILRPKRIKQ